MPGWRPNDCLLELCGLRPKCHGCACRCRVAGKCIGWASSGLYLASRFAQIYKNWQRKNTEGLALAMFACAITANCCYGLGILIRTHSWAELMVSLPWVLGSLGTVALDVTIFMQVRFLRLQLVHVRLLAPARDVFFDVVTVQFTLEGCNLQAGQQQTMLTWF